MTDGGDISFLDELTEETKELLIEKTGCHRGSVVGARGNGKQKMLDEQMEILKKSCELAGICGIDWNALYEVAQIFERKMSELINDVIDAINDMWPLAMSAIEGIYKKLEEYAENHPEDEWEDRHDGATVILESWAAPTPSLRELYGQGIDTGGRMFCMTN